MLFFYVSGKVKGFSDVSLTHYEAAQHRVSIRDGLVSPEIRVYKEQFPRLHHKFKAHSPAS